MQLLIRPQLHRYDLYTVRQLIEKSTEHKSIVSLFFIDLKIAFSSVPREGFGIVLGKLSVADKLVTLVYSFREGMKANIRLEGNLSDEIEVNN